MSLFPSAQYASVCVEVKRSAEYLYLSFDSMTNLMTLVGALAGAVLAEIMRGARQGFTRRTEISNHIFLYIYAKKT